MGSQSIGQSQTATNSIDQNAYARSIAINASPNVAVLNSGPVEQSSGASSGAIAVNDNRASQSNTLDQRADQRQCGPGKHDRGCGKPCRDECNRCKDRCREECRPERRCDY
jgi:hypothetical protein